MVARTVFGVDAGLVVGITGGIDAGFDAGRRRYPTEVTMVYLTKRQREILEFVRSFQAERGYAPSIEEIARHFGLSAVSTVHEHLSNLARKGLIRRGAHRARAIEPIAFGEPAGALSAPLLGTVAAGAPIEAIETPEQVSLPLELAGRGETFVLRVKGDSMVGDGILDGDLIVVERRSRVNNGEMAVVLVGGWEATVKRFHQEGGVVRLRPSNPDMDDIVVPADEIEIRGVVSGLIRRYR